MTWLLCMYHYEYLLIIIFSILNAYFEKVIKSYAPYQFTAFIEIIISFVAKWHCQKNFKMETYRKVNIVIQYRNLILLHEIIQLQKGVL